VPFHTQGDTSKLCKTAIRQYNFHYPYPFGLEPTESCSPWLDSMSSSFAPLPFRPDPYAATAFWVALTLNAHVLVSPDEGRLTLSRLEPTSQVSPSARFMFRCQLCQCVVPPRTPCRHLILKSRSKKYPYRSMANVVIVHEPGKKPKKQYRDDPGGD